MNPMFIKAGMKVKITNTPYESLKNGEIFTITYIDGVNHYVNYDGIAFPFYKHEFEVVNDLK